MFTPKYIPRLLRDAERNEVLQSELMLNSGVSVVLAEPGAGKSELLKHVATQLGTAVERASVFRHKQPVQTRILVIDALDEVAKLDQTAVDAIFVNAQQSGANKIIFASRSSEWDYVRTKFLGDCFGEPPKVYGLHPFNGDEQALLFASLYPDTLFESFFAEVSQHGMENLLGNPTFLKLFAEAFDQTGGKFGSKNEIFEQAIESLARETNSTPGDRGRPADAELIAQSSEIFAVLLLSGAAGISSNAESAVDGFVELQLISDSSKLARLLDTRLFRPADRNDQHEPAHRIIAEYCSGKFLANKVSEISSNVSLRRLLALIAPNGAVRDDLRGLLGWIAAFGNQSVQEAAIDIDAYAILANGDPSRLTASSKRRLLERLIELNEVDPYFRGSDGWRRFSTAGFFTADVVEHVRTILQSGTDESHLRLLLLELLQSSGIASELSDELRQIMLDRSNERFTRLTSRRILAHSTKYDPLPDVHLLLGERSETAFELILDAFNDLEAKNIPAGLLTKVLLIAGGIFDEEGLGSSQTYTLRERIRIFCMSLDVALVVYNLDYFAKNIKCKCNLKKTYRCECRSGLSNVAAILLDTYFEKTVGPHHPKLLWEWLQPLDFSKRSPINESAAITFLEANPALRQSVQRLAFDGMTDASTIREIANHLHGVATTTVHPAIRFREEDSRSMINYAFESDNIALWENYVPSHYWHHDPHAINKNRSYARNQARLKSDFMRIWSKNERSWRKSRTEHTIRDPRIVRRRKRKREVIRRYNDEQLVSNKTQIRAGQSWWWLERFAESFLQRGYEEESFYTHDDPKLAEDALCNCFSFLEDHTPTLNELAELRIESRSSRIQTVLLAASAVVFEKTGTLDAVPKSALRAVMTHLDMHYTGYGGDAKTALEAEVVRCLFTSTEEVENFLRNYIEPQLSGGAEHTNVGWLEYKDPFQTYGEAFAFEWLHRFPVAPVDAQNTLFRIAARSKERRPELNDLIKLRAAQHLFMLPVEFNTDTFFGLRKFWLMRHFYFIEEMHLEVFKVLSREKNSVFAFDNISGPLEHREKQDWPTLTAQKIYAILDAYVGLWPKVSLPSSYGTGSPPEQTAYRFLTNLIWRFTETDPALGISILNQISNDARFLNFYASVKNIRSRISRQLAMRDFDPPQANNVAEFLLGQAVLNVEQLRALFLEELDELQVLLRGAETDPVKMFYIGNKHDKRVNENTARDRIIDLLRPKLEAKNLGISIERHMADSKRCDITLEKSFGGQRSLLVVEVKGQWHRELYTAASAQLHERYSIHPDAAEQGIYLVLWFGGEELIAGCKADHEAPAELKSSIERMLPPEIAKRTDVFVLDLSKENTKGA